MGPVINHVMADSCTMCTWLVIQQLTERQAQMTHQLRMPFLFVDMLTVPMTRRL
jgi:hypothetical protein